MMCSITILLWMYINKLHKYLITFNECRGPSGTLIKEQGSYNLVQNGGNKGPVLRPRCIWPGRARIQTLFYSILFPLYTCILWTGSNKPFLFTFTGWKLTHIHEPKFNWKPRFILTLSGHASVMVLPWWGSVIHFLKALLFVWPSRALWIRVITLQKKNDCSTWVQTTWQNSSSFQS